MRISVIVATAALMLTGGCTEREQKPVPRRRAYPRVELPDTTMQPAPGVPLVMPVNSSAKVSSRQAGWLDVTYPSLGATLHVTFTPINSREELEAVKANRMQRLLLNAGERGGEGSEYMNEHGFDIYLLRAEGVATPVQFLATDDSAWVVSGAAYFDMAPGPGAVDSLRPMVDAVERDVIKSLDGLCRR